MLLACAQGSASVARVPASASPVPQQVVGAASPTAAPLASDVLAGLVVKGRAPKTGYQRALYGEGWTLSLIHI